MAAARGHARRMDRDTANSICSALPGAEVSAPFGPGHDIWKVGGKIFAAIGAEGRGVSVKCADIETAEMLREMGATPNKQLSGDWAAGDESLAAPDEGGDEA